MGRRQRASSGLPGHGGGSGLAPRGVECGCLPKLYPIRGVTTGRNNEAVRLDEGLAPIASRAKLGTQPLNEHLVNRSLSETTALTLALRFALTALLLAPTAARSQTEPGPAEQAEPAKPAVVLHITQATVQAGFAGEALPRVTFPAVVATTKDGESVLVGEEAVAHEELELRRPVVGLKVADWDALESVTRRAFTLLEVDPSEQALITSEGPLVAKADRERLTRFVFEELNVPGYFVANDGVLVMYAGGRITGTALVLRDELALVVPVYEGYCLPHAVLQEEVEAANLGALLARSIQKLGEDVRPEFYANVVVAGEDPVSRELLAKIQIDLLAASPEGTRSGFLAYDHGKAPAWRGASVLAHLDTFVEMWIRPEEFAEVGPKIVHRKCY